MNETIFMSNRRAQPIIVPDIPIGIRDMGGAPRHTIEVDDALFETAEKGPMDPGLYVYVREGDVDATDPDGRVTSIGAGEALRVGLTTGGVRLPVVPTFQKFDNIPDPSKVTEDSEMMLDLFGEEGAEKSEFECVVQ